MIPKIYDCFTYFNEDRLLKLRLETLWDAVDYFVICESVLTFSGNSKPINFKIENFKKYESKIRYLLIKDFPFESDNPWVYEGYQRNYLINGLHDASSDDWILLSDLDEIPNPIALKKFNPKLFLRARLLQLGYSYFMNNLHVDGTTPVLWNKAKLTTYANLKNIFKNMESLREYRPKGFLRGLKRFFVNKVLTQSLSGGGWHFTWMGSVEDMLLKLESFSHQEFNVSRYKDKTAILKKIRSGKDLLDREFTYQLMPIDQGLPTYLSQHTELFEDWILMPAYHPEDNSKLTK
jgi:beta-1,4-mannosyl-glycoprotein beta-1,4-N-acetylglucosaminyltransferase